MNSSNPKVSVLLPAYNIGRYIKEAIDSILDQSFSDFELLVINDGSFDNTETEILSFSDPRIKYIKNAENIGLANTLNKGMKIARGEYIARMDGDDISLKERLKTQVEFLDQHPDVDLCSVALQMFGHSKKLLKGKSDFELIKVDLLFSSAIGHASSMFRTASFLDHDLFFNQDYFPAEDYELWTRAVFHCRMINLPYPLYLYRTHENQVTQADNRAFTKIKQIKLNYLNNSLPGLSVSQKNFFINTFSLSKVIEDINEISKFKDIIDSMILANRERFFFKKEILEKILKRTYQNKIYQTFKTKPRKYISKNPSLLFELRIPQLMKLLFNK